MTQINDAALNLRWSHFLILDGRMRKSRKELPKYDREATVLQILQQIGVTSFSAILILITCCMEYGGNPGKGYQEEEISDTDSFAKRSLHRTTIALWFMAVAIEQGGNFFCCVYGPVFTLSRFCRYSWGREQTMPFLSFYCYLFQF